MGLIVAAGLVGPPAHRKAAEQGGVSVMVTMPGPVKLILLCPAHRAVIYRGGRAPQNRPHSGATSVI